MNATELIYQTARITSDVTGAIEFDGICYLCGSFFSFGLPIKDALKDTFNNRDIALRPDGNGFCAACAFSFQEQSSLIAQKVGKDKPQRFRTYSHLCDEQQWIVCSKADKAIMRFFLLSEHLGYWFACLSESGQKHLIFRCPVNEGTGRFRVLLEEREIETTREELKRLLGFMDCLLDLGASKISIERGEYLQSFLLQADLQSWQIMESTVKPYRGSGAFALALFLARKEDDGRNTTASNSVDSGDSSLNGLVDLGNEAPEILGHARKRNQVSSLHSGFGALPQRALFEDDDQRAGVE